MGKWVGMIFASFRTCSMIGAAFVASRHFENRIEAGFMMGQIGLSGFPLRIITRIGQIAQSQPSGAPSRPALAKRSHCRSPSPP